jgi:hypothetical protein
MEARAYARDKNVFLAHARPDARLSTQKATHLLIQRINCLSRPPDRQWTGPQDDLTFKSGSALQIRRINGLSEP